MVFRLKVETRRKSLLTGVGEMLSNTQDAFLRLELKVPFLSNDSSLDTILYDLEPVLVKLANQPDDLDRAEMLRLRKELNTGSQLFKNSCAAFEGGRGSASW